MGEKKTPILTSNLLLQDEHDNSNCNADQDEESNEAAHNTLMHMIITWNDNMASRIVRVRIYRNDSCATTRVWLWSWVVVYVLWASDSIFHRLINWSRTLANDNEEREQIEKKVQKKRVAVRTWLRVASDLALQFPHWSLVNPGFLSQHAWFFMVFISSGLRHCWQRTWS